MLQSEPAKLVVPAEIKSRGLIGNAGFDESLQRSFSGASCSVVSCSSSGTWKVASWRSWRCLLAISSALQVEVHSPITALPHPSIWVMLRVVVLVFDDGNTDDAQVDAPHNTVHSSRATALAGHYHCHHHQNHHCQKNHNQTF